MSKAKQVAVQERVPRFTPVQADEIQASSVVSLFLRKIVLAALTMFGIGYVLTNATVVVLLWNSWSTISIASQANISAIAGRILFIIASVISMVLGGLFIFGGVQFYEQGQTKGVTLLGVLFGCFYLLCLGVGSTFLLGEVSLSALMLIAASILVGVSAASYVSEHAGFRLVGSVLGVVGGVFLAYAVFNLQVLGLVFEWGVPFTGPFMSLAVLECVVVVLSPVAAGVSSFVGGRVGERPFARVFVLLVGLVYGVGAFVGSLVLSLNFWNFIWKSPWVGPFFGLSEFLLSVVVFWSASLVLLEIGGVLLIVGVCLGFVYVAREFSRL